MGAHSRQAIHDLYGGLPGRGDTFHNSDSFDNPGGMGRLTAVRAWGNTRARPAFVDAVQHDYALQRHSRLGRRHVGTSGRMV